MNPNRRPGSLDDLDKHGIEFVGTEAPNPLMKCPKGIWLRCLKCNYTWGVLRGSTPDRVWRTCQRPPKGCRSKKETT